MFGSNVASKSATYLEKHTLHRKITIMPACKEMKSLYPLFQASSRSSWWKESNQAYFFLSYMSALVLRFEVSHLKHIFIYEVSTKVAKREVIYAVLSCVDFSSAVLWHSKLNSPR